MHATKKKVTTIIIAVEEYDVMASYLISITDTA
jgi:hypothetical protein